MPARSRSGTISVCPFGKVGNILRLWGLNLDLIALGTFDIPSLK
jgi:hypothetical protein